MSKIKVFEKNYKKEDGSTFAIKRAVIINENDKNQVLQYRLKFKTECKEKFEKDFIKGDFTYPIEIEVTPDNYFFGLSKADKNGKQWDELILLDYSNMQQSKWDLPPRETFEDKFNKKYGKFN